MDIINFFVNLLSDPRGAIAGWIIALGPLWVYSPLFLIVFVETGLVFFPFLPGDSLLFAAGVFSADGGGLNVWATLIVFYVAAILGNTSNYWIARFFGARIIDSGKVKALTPERMSMLVGAADGLAQRESVHARQHHVQNGGIAAGFLRQQRQGGFGAFSLHHLHPRMAQVQGDHIADIGFIFYNKHSYHAASSIP